MGGVWGGMRFQCTSAANRQAIFSDIASVSPAHPCEPETGSSMDLEEGCMENEVDDGDVFRSRGVKKKSKAKGTTRKRKYEEFQPVMERFSHATEEMCMAPPSLNLKARSVSSPSSSVQLSSSDSVSVSAVIMEQRVNGSFELTPRLASLLGVSVEKLKEVMSTLQIGDGEVAQKVIATAAVLVFFEKKCNSQKDVWDLCANKAKRFIEKQGTSKSLSEILKVWIIRVLFTR